jgi:Zn-dependent protease
MGLIGYLLMIPGAFFAPAIHEFVKARVSTALGDKTPRHNGFVTWNPFKFFEPIGFIFMLIFRVGWGQPVTTSPFYYKDKRKGIALTYTAPIVANLFVGMLTYFLLSIFPSPPMTGININDVDLMIWLLLMIQFFGQLNINLALFNLIPIYPLAMSKMIHIFVSPETSMKLNHYEKPLQILLVFLLLFGMHSRILFPIANLIIRAVSF